MSAKIIFPLQNMLMQLFIQALAKDLTKALFSDLAHVRVQVTHHRHIVLTGGRFKHKIVDWLKAKGF